LPTRLTTPEVRVAVTTATLDGWSLDIVRTPELGVNQAKTVLFAKVTMRDDTGKELDVKTLRRDVASLPTGVRTQIATFHTALITALRQAGVLPAGTDTPDL
jgi:hypothetical protein